MHVIKLKLAGAYSLSSLKLKYESNAFEFSEIFSLNLMVFQKKQYLSWLIWFAFNSIQFREFFFNEICSIWKLIFANKSIFLENFWVKWLSKPIVAIEKSFFLKKEVPIILIFDILLFYELKILEQNQNWLF